MVGVSTRSTIFPQDHLTMKSSTKPCALSMPVSGISKAPHAMSGNRSAPQERNLPVAYAQPQPEQGRPSLVFDVEEVVPWNQIQMHHAIQQQQLQQQQQHQGLKISFTVSFPPPPMPVAAADPSLMNMAVQYQQQQPNKMTTIQGPVPGMPCDLSPTTMTPERSGQCESPSNPSHCHHTTIEGPEQSQNVIPFVENVARQVDINTTVKESNHQNNVTPQVDLIVPTAVTQEVRAAASRPPVEGPDDEAMPGRPIPALPTTIEMSSPTQQEITTPSIEKDDKRMKSGHKSSLSTQQRIVTPSSTKESDKTVERSNQELDNEKRSNVAAHRMPGRRKNSPAARKQLFPKHALRTTPDHMEFVRKGFNVPTLKSPTTPVPVPVPAPGMTEKSQAELKESKRIACSSAPRIPRSILRAQIIRPKRNKAPVRQIICDSLGRLSSPSKTQDMSSSRPVSRRVQSSKSISNQGKPPVIPPELFSILSPLKPSSPQRRREIIKTTATKVDKQSTSVTPEPPRRTSRRLSSRASKTLTLGEIPTANQAAEQIEVDSVLVKPSRLPSSQVVRSGERSTASDYLARNEHVGAENYLQSSKSSRKSRAQKAKERVAVAAATTKLKDAPAPMGIDGDEPVSARKQQVRKRSSLGYQILNRNRSKAVVVAQTEAPLATVAQRSTQKATGRIEKRGSVESFVAPSNETEDRKTRASIVPKKQADSRRTRPQTKGTGGYKARPVKERTMKNKSQLGQKVINKKKMRKDLTSQKTATELPSSLKRTQKHPLSSTLPKQDKGQPTRKKRKIGVDAVAKGGGLIMGAVQLSSEEENNDSCIFDSEQHDKKTKEDDVNGRTHEQSQDSKPPKTATTSRKRRWTMPECSLATLPFATTTASTTGNTGAHPKGQIRHGFKQDATKHGVFSALTQRGGYDIDKKKLSLRTQDKRVSSMKAPPMHCHSRRRRQRRRRTFEPVDSMAILTNVASTASKESRFVKSNGFSTEAIPWNEDGDDDDAPRDTNHHHLCNDAIPTNGGRLGLHLSYLFAETGIDDKYKTTTNFLHAEIPFPLTTRGMATTPLTRVLKNHFKKGTLDQYLQDKFGVDDDDVIPSGDELGEERVWALRQSNRKKIAEYGRRIRLWEWLRED